MRHETEFHVNGHKFVATVLPPEPALKKFWRRHVVDYVPDDDATAPVDPYPRWVLALTWFGVFAVVAVLWAWFATWLIG